MKKIKILVVEDEAIIAKDLQWRLQNMGYDVPLMVANGEEVVEKIKDIKPDLVLMDIILKGEIDGIEASSRILLSFDIPIIYLTAYTDKKMMERAKITEPFGYLIKPVNNRELQITIEMSLYRHKTEKELERHREHLMKLVDERTAELKETNLKLKQEIEEHKNTEKELCNSEEKYHGIIETSPDLIFILERKTGKIIDINRSVCKFLGYSKDEIVGTVSGDRVVSAQRDSYRIELENLIKNERFSGEYDIRKKDGSILKIEARGAVFGDYAFAIGRDITERRQLEKEILEIEDKERQRIGQDLHDDFGQLLSALSFKCLALKLELENKPCQEADDAKEITAIVDDAKERVRLMSRGLMPVEIDRQGLMTALEELSEKTVSIFDTSCVFKCDNPVQISDETVNLHLYRIAQESITNAIKHGKSGNIEISLDKDYDKIIMKVKDDGSGIPDNYNQTNGTGIRIMNYRANLINAQLDIRSDNHKGTTVTCVYLDNILKKGSKSHESGIV